MSLGASGTWARAPDKKSGARTYKVTGFSQVASGLPQGWPPRVDVTTREYGTGQSGPGDADENRCEESSGRTCTVLMGYAVGPTAGSAPGVSALAVRHPVRGDDRMQVRVVRVRVALGARTWVSRRGERGVSVLLLVANGTVGGVHTSVIAAS